MKLSKKLALATAVLALVAVAGAAIVLLPDRPAADVDAQYRTEDSHFVELPDGTRLHYLEKGDRDAPVLVLVHGSFDSAFTWEKVLPPLAQEFRVIALDLPAHGLTGRTARDEYTMDAMVETLHGLCEQLGLTRFALAGNSMGGNTAWLYALSHPERVEKLVLIDSAGYPTTGEALVEHDLGPVMRWLYRHGNPTLKVRAGFDRAVADPTAVSDAYVDRAVDFLRRAGSRDAQLKRNKLRQIQQQPFGRIHEITTPALIVWGERDELLPVEAAHRFHHDLAGSELRIYQGIAHMPQLESPERLLADMRAFLRAPAQPPTQAPAPVAVDPMAAQAEP